MDRLEPPNPTFCFIGVIHTPWLAQEGTPIQPSKGRDVHGTVEVYPEYSPGLQDLEGFDRIWLIYWFHRAGPSRLTVTPYLDSVPRGLFATRAPTRPNPIGLSSVALDKIEGNILHIRDVDILDGTPLLDIKPHVPEFDHYSIQHCGWLDDIRFDTKSGRADNRFDE